MSHAPGSAIPGAIVRAVPSPVPCSRIPGLSTVHVNRVPQELRKEGLIRFQGDALTILDWERLTKVGEFTSTYLSLQNEDRWTRLTDT